MDPSRVNELLEVAERLSADAKTLRDELDLEFRSSQLAAVVDEDYDLGEVVGVDQIFGGYVNLSFAVRTRTAEGEQRYFVRKYSRAITKSEIRFEHALVNHIYDKGFHLAARVYPNKAGGTFVVRDEVHGGVPETRFFAVYQMLEGQDPYTWVKNRCTDAEYADAARVLAQFHHAAYDFEAGESPASSRPIMAFVATLEKTFSDCAALATGGLYDDYYLSKLPAIVQSIHLGTSIAADSKACPSYRCAATTTPATRSGSTNAS